VFEGEIFFCWFVYLDAVRTVLLFLVFLVPGRVRELASYAVFSMRIVPNKLQ
jgi:hypothetical protein